MSPPALQNSLCEIDFQSLLCVLFVIIGQSSEKNLLLKPCKIKAIWKILNVNILLYFKVICEKILHSRSFGLPVSYPGLLSSKHLNKRIKTVSTHHTSVLASLHNTVSG